MTDKTLQEVTSELDAVTAKNQQLLNELKTVKATNKELTEEVDQHKDRVNTVDAKLRDIHLNSPVDDMLQQLFVIAPKYARQEIEDFYQFSLDDSANVQFRDKDGKPVMIIDGDKKREALFTESDIYSVLSQNGRFDSVIRGSNQAGSGAPPSGSRGPAGTERQVVEEPSYNFGLR